MVVNKNNNLIVNNVEYKDSKRCVFDVKEVLCEICENWIQDTRKDPDIMLTYIV